MYYMKSEVYSIRLAPDLRDDLERIARRRKTSLAQVITTASKEFVKRNAAKLDDEAEQRRLHRELEKCIGAYAGDDPKASQRVNEVVRESLRRKYGR